MDLSKLPKQFCDNVNMGYSEEFFILALLSGQNASIFALTPEHAKRLSLSLSYNIVEFENKFGAIKTEWFPGIQSPIQMIDLDKPKEEGK
jgi:hypothetical protein